MFDRSADPRTEDTVVFEVMRTARGAEAAEVIGTATFRGGRTTIDASDEVQIAIEELLTRAFVDRVQADERPRGYRRSGSGMVDMLVPGMPEHFIARLRGLWLSYPDGSVVTARPASGAASTEPGSIEPSETGSPVTDAQVRRSTLVNADRRLGVRPLVLPHAPDDGRRPDSELAPGASVDRTDCGWLV
ncbi:MAG: hypothetical protein ABIO99_05265 [Candidatus Limnocylindria bacterium]